MADRLGLWRTTGLIAFASMTAAAAFLVSSRPLHEHPPATGPDGSEEIGAGQRDNAASVPDNVKPPSIPHGEPGPDLRPPGTPALPDTDMALPSFDLVRIGARGDAIVAGAGAPDSDIVLLLDGQEVTSVLSDNAGNFVMLFDAPPSRRPRVLTLETRDAAGAVTRARDSVIVAPAGPPDSGTPTSARIDATAVDSAGVAVTAADEGIPAGPAEIDGATTALAAGTVDVAEDAVPVAAPDGTSPPSEDGGAEPALTPADAAPAAPEPGRSGPAMGAVSDIASARTSAGPAAAPWLFRSGPDGVSVLSEPVPSPDVLETLGIDAITYDAAGDVALAGRGPKGASIRIYLDDRPVALARVGRDGAWSAPLSDVKAGIYRLRIDEIGEDGAVAARIETPFERTAPAIAAAARLSGATAITVQPGFTLWAISEGYFGEGIRYVQIFEANRSLIRDPDLIYPGQVFALPQAGE